MVGGVARPWRIERAGGCYHVTARGNERHAIFRDGRSDGEFQRPGSLRLRLIRR